MNNSTTTPFAYFGEIDIWIFSFILPTVTVLGLGGNVLVVWAVLGSPSMRNSIMNIMLTNLAVADFGNLIFSAADWMQILLSKGPFWLMEEWLCPVIRHLEMFFLYTSVLLQVTVAIERYVAIVYPLQVRLICSKGNGVLTSLCLWVFAALFSLPYSLAHSLHSFQGGNGTALFICQLNSPLPVLFKMTEFLIFYFCPLTLLCVLYSHVSLTLWRSGQRLHESIRRASEDAAVTRLRGRKNVVKMLVACVAMYFICFSPIQVIFILDTIANWSFRLPFTFFLSVNTICYASSSCNPLLYTIFSRNFRVRFTEILSCRRICIRDSNSRAARSARARHRKARSYYAREMESGARTSANGQQSGSRPDVHSTAPPQESSKQNCSPPVYDEEEVRLQTGMYSDNLAEDEEAIVTTRLLPPTSVTTTQQETDLNGSQ